MLISPSIASADLLHIAEEVDFADKHFDNLHLDVEDGVAVHSISFGFKMCSAICIHSTASEISMHLEIVNPLAFIEEIKACGADIVFIQVDCQENPLDIIREFQKCGIPTGVNLSNLDMNRRELSELLSITDSLLINTTHHDDRTQTCDMEMLRFALKLAEEGKKVWVDGGITYEIYQGIKDSRIHAAVMGRAIFADKEKALELFIK